MFITQTNTKKKSEEQNKVFVCSSCNEEYIVQKGNFYKTKSELYRGNECFTNICINCITAKFKSIEAQTGSTRMALICICHLLDTYYNEKDFNNMVSKNTFSIGAYLNSSNLRQAANKTFMTNLLQNDFAKAIKFEDTDIEVKEELNDIKNRSFCTSQLGYDPFLENIPADRKYLFNTLAEYLTDDVIEDPHKLQSVVPLVKSILQESKIDRLIDAELKSKVPNDTNLKAYVESKKSIRGLINSIANDNGLTVKGGGKTGRGASTLTGIMKEMAENGFDEIKINVFDSKMNGAFKYIADISNKSLNEQLNFQSDDYARMVATQREMIQKYDEENLSLAEQNRLLKIENKKLNELIKDGDKE